MPKLSEMIEIIQEQVDKGVGLTEKWDRTGLLDHVEDKADMAFRLESLMASILREPSTRLGKVKVDEEKRMATRNLLYLQAKLDKKWIHVFNERIIVGNRPRRWWMPIKNPADLCSVETFTKLLKDGGNAEPIVNEIEVVNNKAAYINSGALDYWESRKCSNL